MSIAAAERNMLLGVLAMQMDFVTREDLIAATSVWLKDKSKGLEQILLDTGRLDAEEHTLLAALVDKHIANHSNDTKQSLARVRFVAPDLQESLSQLQDPDVHASLASIRPSNKTESDPLATYAQPTEIADAYDRFQVLRPHASGGLGEVFVAQDSELNREVALKEIRPAHAFEQESQARFLLEAEITGRLEHPAIVPVYSLGRHQDGRPFYAMRFIRGSSMDDAISEFYGDDELSASQHSSLRFRELLGNFMDVCEAVAYAHSRGILHRDIKPSNVMLGRYGETLVVDWGLAKALNSKDDTHRATPALQEDSLLPLSNDSGSATLQGKAIGTPAYMSPEQAAGKIDRLEATTDVYALGATLYHLLTGKPSQKVDGDLGKTLRSIEDGKFQRPRAVNPHVAKPLEAVCLKAMSLEPEDRYSTAEALARDLERWLGDQPVQAYREPTWVTTRRWLRRNPGIFGTLATTIVAVLIGLTSFSTFQSIQKRQLSNKNMELEISQTRLQRQATELAETNSALQETQQVLDTANQQLIAKNEALVAAETAARSEARAANGAVTFLTGILQETDPVALSGRIFAGVDSPVTRTVQDVVQSGTEQLDVAFPDEDERRAKMLHALGSVWLSYGKNDVAGDLLRESHRIRQEICPEGSITTLSSQHALGRLASHSGDFELASELLLATIEEARAKLEEDLTDEERREVNVLLAESLFDLGIQWVATERHQSARGDGMPMLREALALNESLHGKNSRQTLITLIALAQAGIVGEDGGLSGYGYLLRAFNILAELKGGQDFEQAVAAVMQAQVWQGLKQFSPASASYERAIAQLKVALGDPHFGLTFVRRQHASMLYWEQGSYAPALEKWTQVRDDYVTMHGADSILVGEAEVMLCRCNRKLEDYSASALHGKAAFDVYKPDPRMDLAGFETMVNNWLYAHLLMVREETESNQVYGGPRFQEAMQAYQQYFAIAEKFDIADDPILSGLHQRLQQEQAQMQEQASEGKANAEANAETKPTSD